MQGPEIEFTSVARPTPEERGWQRARLFSTSGIRGADEQERRAASALLSVMAAVPAFGRAVLADFRAPSGRLVTYTEVPLELPSGAPCRPDGAVVVARGNTTWACLVEVKTGASTVEAEQLANYLDAAREHDFQGVVSISNEITNAPTDLPVVVDKRRIGKLLVRHVSWWQIVTAAVVQYRHKGISDPDQAWILGELIAYLTHPNSGATGFRDMGAEWVAVRDAVRNGTLRTTDSEAAAVVMRWQQFVRYLCLSLSQELGRPVQPARPAKHVDRTTAIRELVSSGGLRTSLRVPDAAGPIDVDVDLRAQRVDVSVEVDAPQDRRGSARVNWLLKQLRDAPPDLRVDAAFVNLKETTSELLSRARDEPKLLLLANDPKREPRSFRVTLSRPMALRRGREGDSFIRETLRQVLDFYADLVQQLRPWRAPPPQVKERDRDRVLEAATAELDDAESHPTLETISLVELATGPPLAESAVPSPTNGGGTTPSTSVEEQQAQST